MLNFYSRLSPTTRLLIQSFLAVLGSVLVGTGTAVYQSYTTTGYIDIASIWVAASLAFALLFGKAMHDWIPPHAQQLIAAGKENEAALYDALQRQQLMTSSVIASSDAKNAVASSQSQPAPILHVYVPQTAQLTPPDVSKMETASVPVPQLPFPEPVSIPMQPTMPEMAAVSPDLHFGDSQLIPVVTPTP
jgi:hypothetical protein